MPTLLPGNTVLLVLKALCPDFHRIIESDNQITFPADYDYRLKEMKPKFVLADPDSITNVRKALINLDFVSEAFSLGADGAEGFTPVEELLRDAGDGK